MFKENPKGRCLFTRKESTTCPQKSTTSDKGIEFLVHSNSLYHFKAPTELTTIWNLLAFGPLCFWDRQSAPLSLCPPPAHRSALWDNLGRLVKNKLFFLPTEQYSFVVLLCPCLQNRNVPIGSHDLSLYPSSGATVYVLVL